MTVKKDPAMTALIERICESHRDKDSDGPLVTMLDGAWAYCAGRREAEHDWRAIEPTPRLLLEEQIASR